MLDGWWDEAFNGTNGWAVGGSAGRADPPDADDAEALYRALETEIVPTFFERDSMGLPRSWIGYMRGALRTALGQFTAERVLRDYVDEVYRPVAGVGEVRAGIG